MASIFDMTELNNGVRMPVFGLGTSGNKDQTVCNETIKAAVDAGYRLIDTAQMYENEEQVGKAIHQLELSDKNLFITSKLDNTNHGYEAASKAIDDSLEKLGLEYIDLYLIHWPVVKGREGSWQEDNIETWRALEDAYDAGKVKAIGVSNFMVKHLENLISNCRIKPMVNQIRLHPGVLQEEIVVFCEKENITVEAWSPLSPLKQMSEDEKVKAMMEKYRKTIAQLLLRFSLQHNFIPLTKSSKAERVVENADVFDFEISKEDMDYLNRLKFDDLEAPDVDEER
ncbi:aldo/keto reductase [Pisciglobus halotolerans]|uniref:Aldo/keto reductase n=1 Tax=Pisciglobus halotolerans TaxID=745365 RepID=A0A1I3CBJ6_9LACT|nr:aldo/keto reductase [Pisciglobus halotolerans]SFH71920.1 Aldo/keto reductase [Pisciglobus halotolerans]